MKYFKINIRFYNDNQRIVSDAEGEKIPNAEEYFWRMNKGEIIQNAPIFDYFYLKSFDTREYWEWKLLDVHGFIGEGSQIKGWLISQKLKFLLEKFILSKPYYFYPSKLLYKDKKLDYYIFQFTGKLTFEQGLLYIDYSKTLFWNPIKKENVIISNKEEFISTYRKIYKDNGSLDFAMQNKRLILKEKLDFFPMQMFLKDNIISERLKNALEEIEIEGFEFSELDYEVIVNE
jgi:hypothetical protein